MFELHKFPSDFSRSHDQNIRTSHSVSIPDITQMVDAWTLYLNALHWQDFVRGIAPKVCGCGDVYELTSPLGRPYESFAIADMRQIKFSNPHYHTNGETEIYIVLQGTGIVVVGGKEIAVQPGSVVVTPPNTAHFVVPTHDLVLAVINTPPFKSSNVISVTQSDVGVQFDQEQFMRLSLQEDELLDLVNAADEVIGQVYRSEVYAKKLSGCRVINAFLINSKSQVWIPRRSPHKKLFPSCLDASVGGHVMAGENYEQAFAREALEELNLDISQHSWKHLVYLNPHEHTISAHMQVYGIMTDHSPTYNQNDFVHASWLSLDEFEELLKRGEPAKGDLHTLVQVLREHATQHVAK